METEKTVKTKEELKQEEKWQIERDIEALTRYAELYNDKKRLKLAKEELIKKADAIKKVTKD